MAASTAWGDVDLRTYGPLSDVFYVPTSEVVFVTESQTLLRLSCRDADGPWVFGSATNPRMPLVCTCTAVAPGVTCVGEVRR